MAQIAKAKNIKKQKADDTGRIMMNLIKNAINVSKVMASLKNDFGSLYGAVGVAVQEYLVEEAIRLGEDPQEFAKKFFEMIYDDLTECVKYVLDNSDKDSN